MKKILVLLLLMLFSTNVFAELSLLKYDNMSKAEKNSYKNYINGLGTSSGWMIIFEEGRNKEYKKLYCQPEQFSLNANNFVEILEQRIDKIKALNHYDLDKTFIEYELIKGLIDTFPCN